MNWHLVSFANDKFKENQEFLHKIHSQSFYHHPYTREVLETTEFYKENKDILDEETGAGWWIWKPYVILDTLKNAQDGDLVVYSDCGDMFSPGLQSYAEGMIGEDDICLLMVGNNKNKHYTKRDCFILMDCDEEDYWESNQLEAGFTIWKVCEKSKSVVEEWMNYCLNPQVIKNDSSILGEELDGFVEHRNDQSVLTNLAIREGLSVAGSDYRNYVECDYDYWYERGARSYGREIDQFLMSIKDA